MQSVGFNKISIVGNNLIKQNPLTKLDFNAIAKGYAVDILADLLEAKRIKNYLIDIGGEIKSNGINIMNNSPWTVAINNPDLSSKDKFYKIINLKKSALATSGNYRNLYPGTWQNQFQNSTNDRIYTNRTKVNDFRQSFNANKNMRGTSELRMDALKSIASSVATKVYRFNPEK